MRTPLFLVGLMLASCGEPAKVGESPAEEQRGVAADTLTATPRPVRIGELGPNFQACSAAGTTRSLKGGDALPVRRAPFENAGDSGSVPAGARFFICTRSHDQKWFGIVFDESGTLAERCGVAEPVTRRRDYDGPCRSGWVQSAFVKVVAGEEPAPAPAQGNDSAPAGA